MNRVSDVNENKQMIINIIFLMVSWPYYIHSEVQMNKPTPVGKPAGSRILCEEALLCCSARVQLSPTLGQTDTQSCSALYIDDRLRAENRDT